MTIDYSSWLKSYVKFRESNFDFAKALISGANLNKDSKILEVGSGTGNYCRLIKDLTGADIVGMDSSKDMIKKSKEISKNINFKLADALHLPFKDNSFDFIFYFDVIHHIRDLPKCLGEAFRVLKTGGKICVITNSTRQIKERITAKYFPSVTKIDLERYYPTDRIRKELLAHDFNKIKVIRIVSKKKRPTDINYYNLIKAKSFSVLHSVPKMEFEEGLKKLKLDLNKGQSAAQERIFIFAEKNSN